MSLTPKSRKIVEQWVARQAAKTPLLPSMAARELRGQMDAVDVAEALARLSVQGRIRRVFAVRVPSGPVLRAVYRSLDEIEPEVRDQLNRPVSRDDLEILPAFEKVGA